MLRDILVRLPGFGTWPCDEINFIWRHGNAGFPSDEFREELARPEVIGYIRRRFERIAERYRLAAVVEKTCANSLRLEFVDKVLPDARYVFIRRNGLDATASALRRWRAPVELSYIARKARFIPVGDVPYYGIRFLYNRAHRLLSGQRRLATWGPVLPDMGGLMQRHSLEEVCALQWKRCVDRAQEALAALPASRHVEVVYEDFVARPEDNIERIADFLGVRPIRADLRPLVSEVSAASVGKGITELGDVLADRLTDLIRDTMKRNGYI